MWFYIWDYIVCYFVVALVSYTLSNDFELYLGCGMEAIFGLVV